MFAPPTEYTARIVDTVPAEWAPAQPHSAWLAERPQYASYNSFLEGPAFDRHGQLVCVDILGGRVLRHVPGSGFEVLSDYEGAPNGLAIHRDGRLFIADHQLGLVIVNPVSGAWSVLLDRALGEPFKGLNDLTFAPNGDLYFTDQGQSGLQDPSGRLFRLAVDGRLEVVLERIPSPNGLAFDRAGETLWLAVTRANQVWRLPLRGDGRATKVGVFVQLQGSGPDGLAVADDDSVWVAQPGVGSIWGFSRHGEPIARIRSASTGGMTTNLAFGWPADGAFTLSNQPQARCSVLILVATALRCSPISLLTQPPVHKADSTEGELKMSKQVTDAGNALTSPPTPTRRRLLLAAAAAGSALITGRSLAAATWPEKPLNILVGYSAGGSLDQMVRLVAQQISGELGQNVLVENRPGAAGTLAAAAVVRAPADGYTFLAGGDPELLLAPRTMRLSYDPSVDLDTLCVAATVPLVLAIHADRPERTIAELIASARRAPINCAVPGARTPMTLAAMAMNRELGTQLNPVPYQGGSAVARDVAGGQVALGMTGPLSVEAMVKAGRVRVLAVLQRERARLLPEVPAMGEVGLRGFQAQALNVFSSRKDVPEHIRVRFATAVRRALATAPIADRLRAGGVDPVALAPDESRRLISQLGTELDVAVKAAGWTRE